MQLIVTDAQQAAVRAAGLYVDLLRRKPDAVLGLATGSTPLGLYARLAALYRAGELSFRRATSFNLDEYVGLPATHDQSYRYFMEHNLFSHVDLPAARTHVPSGLDVSDAALAGYDAAIEAAGGIDLQLLGLGGNGHIGFNEPDDHFTCGCHVVNLTESTIQANRRFFDSEASVPRQAVSLGVGSILASRCILLLATGEDKAQAIHDTVCGDITSRTPASILKTHPNVILLLDRAAAGML